MYWIKKFTLWQSPVQFSGNYITGQDVYIEIVKVGILYSCAQLSDLKFFEANPDRIPTEWYGKRIYAWGSVKESGGEEYVSYLNCMNPQVPEVVEYCLCLEWDQKDFVLHEIWNAEQIGSRVLAQRT